MSTKPKSIFAGMKLTEQTPLASPLSPDQRLFAPPSARPAPLPAEPETQQEGNPETPLAGFHENQNAGKEERGDSRDTEKMISGKPEIGEPRKPESRKDRKTERLNAREDESLQTRKQGTLKLDKYSTQLRGDTVKQIKRYALDTDRKDYEVVQEALDEYFAKKRVTD